MSYTNTTKAAQDSEMLGGRKQVRGENPVAKIIKEAPLVAVGGAAVVGSLVYGLRNSNNPIKSGQAMTTRVGAQLLAVVTLVGYASYSMSKDSKTPPHK